ncbi:hypothetical protein [Georgenia sp. H159]|uniref:hypothetical protein n=1 Tax=Georgenia sp. H159 TaxID=3076115 RepID=UPI002D79E494|nr:hypothetical protein [Georgenia sp. H159]
MIRDGVPFPSTGRPFIGNDGAAVRIDDIDIADIDADIELDHRYRLACAVGVLEVDALGFELDDPSLAGLVPPIGALALELSLTRHQGDADRDVIEDGEIRVRISTKLIDYPVVLPYRCLSVLRRGL